jgi:hypothetical protein
MTQIITGSYVTQITPPHNPDWYLATYYSLSKMIVVQFTTTFHKLK